MRTLLRSIAPSVLALSAATTACWRADLPAASSGSTDVSSATNSLRASVSITLLHTNDVHSRIEPVAQAGGHDLGGVVRRKAAIDRVRQERGADHVLLVDAGDFSVGTPYFGVWKGSESVMAMNALDYDAITVGNHEFDLGPEGLARTLRGGSLTVGTEARPTEALFARVVVSNLDVSKDAALRDRIVPRAIVSRGGVRYGIVGAITEQLAEFSSPGPTVRVLPYVESVQAQVDALAADGIDKVILLSHCGTDVDAANAPKLRGVDVVVAAHDHALFGDAEALRKQGLVDVTTNFKGPYPRVAKDKDGQTTLLVSAYEWGRVLGRLDLTFDAAGHIEEGWHGGPIVLSSDDGADASFEAKVQAYRAPVVTIGAEVLGTATHPITRSPAGPSELGSLFADATLAAGKSNGAVGALGHGDARSDIPAGRITVAQLFDVWPYEGAVVVVSLTGAELEEVVAHGLSLDPPSQLAGITATIARGASPAPLRVVDLKVGGRPVSKDARYAIAVDDYIAKGGDGFATLKAAAARDGGIRPTGITVRDALTRAIKAHSPVAPKVSGRVIEAAPK